MTFTCGDQRDFADQAAHNANYWLGDLPADLSSRYGLAERLEGFVFSMLVELEGSSGLDQHRLSPKGRPDLNLVEDTMHEVWASQADCDPRTRAFLDQLRAAVEGALRQGPDGRAAMLQVLVSFASLIERDYELAPLYFDDDGEDDGEGPNIAPGLAAAVEAAWKQRETQED